MPDSYDESEIYFRGTINQSMNGSNLNQMIKNQNKLQQTQNLLPDSFLMSQASPTNVLQGPTPFV